MRELINRRMRWTPQSPQTFYFLMCGIGLGMAVTLALLSAMGGLAQVGLH